jgi:hypothetical protein
LEELTGMLLFAINRKMAARLLLILLETVDGVIANNLFMAIIMFLQTVDVVDLSGAFVVDSLKILNRRDSNTNSYLGRNNLASLLRYLSREAEDGTPMYSAQALADMNSPRMVAFFRTVAQGPLQGGNPDSTV